MFISKPAFWLALAAAATCGAARAQGATGPNAPPPYQSVLEGYKPFTEEQVVPWPHSNATVGRIGGWRAYAREAAQTRPPAPPSTAPAGPATPAGGHKH